MLPEPRPELSSAPPARGVGLDFGTANSYLSTVPVGIDTLTHTDLKIGQAAAIPTCLLVRTAEPEFVITEAAGASGANGGHKPSTDLRATKPVDDSGSATRWTEERGRAPHEAPLTLATSGSRPPGTRFKSFGEDAVAEWEDLAPEERTFHRFAAGFKPDLHVRPQARADAVMFLSALRQKAAHTFGPEVIERSAFVVGYPANAGDRCLQALRDVLAEAGFDRARPVEEPRGALLYHLGLGDLKAEEARRAVLVIDFGGGTTDVALLDGARVMRSWGDPVYGGRLFDDLFFRWWLERNEKRDPKLLQRVRALGHLDFIRMRRCREMKELFSNWLARESRTPFRFTVAVGMDVFGALQGATREEFLERARNYVPTPEMLADLGDQAERLKPWPVNLLARLDHILTAPVREGLAPERVILTGGSARWPFLKEMVEHGLGVDPSRVCRSGDPEASVGRGLALLPALEHRERQARERMAAERDTLVAGLYDDARAAAESFAKHVAEECARELYDGRMVPLNRRFLAEGGKLCDLERRVAEACEGFENPLSIIIERERAAWERGVSRLWRARLLDFMRRFGIRRELAASLPAVRDMPVAKVAAVPLTASLLRLHDWAAGLTSLVVATAVASISGGAGVALIAAGPWGLVAGAALSLAVMGPAALYLRGKLKEIPLSPRVLGALVGEAGFDRHVAEGRERFENGLRDQVRAAVAECRADIEEQARLVCERLVREVAVTDLVGGGEGR